MIEAHAVLRYVPIVYLISPSTGKQIAVPMHNGLTADDARDLADRSLKTHFGDTPNDILHELRLVNLIEHAGDWRFMNEQEIDDFKTRIPPFFEPPYDVSNEE